MAKSKTMSLTLNRRLSDDNYGSYGAEVSLEVEFEKGDTEEEVEAALRDSLESALKKAVKTARLQKKESK